MITLADIRTYCSEKKGSWEDFPFDDETLVFKVGKKMYALADITSKPVSLNLKCDPDLALKLRDKYKSVREGYHMNKRHWNTVIVDETIPEKTIYDMIDISYDLVLTSLTRKDREDL